jgi:hypothetical protein
LIIVGFKSIITLSIGKRKEKREKRKEKRDSEIFLKK